ncbi:hypothetical protein OG562_35655 [Streptomyces sp. NBC_01275]|uniref:hypothetical protein n=1 Tax=Streptomyces sp. NBC_01275 TaxID=2903807 RepID=UPI00225C3D9E|nr:hypothetical protein [Streptomyces sp. NBC_01275]MCX4766224.1 hypothetical protein [Streptomyces sp. NBC_01275]
MSRRALLGYSSSAAAGAVLASAGSAQAEESSVAEEAAESTAVWEGGNTFHGVTSPGPEDGSISMTFSLDFMASPTAQEVTPLDVANAINELLASRGWSDIQFYGTVTKALN